MCTDATNGRCRLKWSRNSKQIFTTPNYVSFAGIRYAAKSFLKSTAMSFGGAYRPRDLRLKPLAPRFQIERRTRSPLASHGQTPGRSGAYRARPRLRDKGVSASDPASWRLRV